MFLELVCDLQCLMRACEAALLYLKHFLQWMERTDKHLEIGKEQLKNTEFQVNHWNR